MQQTSTTDLISEGTDLPVLTMVEPMLGFSGHRRFALARLDEEGVVCDLRSLDDPDLRFVVVPPGLFFPDYAPEISEATVSALRTEAVEDLLALVVVTVGASLVDATANLLAPVVVDTRTRLAAQVVLDDPELPVRAPLLPDHAPEG